jgi:ATP-dependent DNA helicase RecG
MFESNNVEFKREYTADIKKEVIAFANTDGGVIYIGKDNDGNVYSLSNIDEILSQVTNSIRDSVLPDITMFINYDISETGLKITVQEGTNKPYYLADKGLRPAGVYVRQGASSVPASHEQIRQMIKLTDGDRFETARSLIQELTFKDLADEFESQNIEFGENQKRTLGITGSDGLYTNLGLLLSDQCTHTVKLAVFKGVTKFEFKTRKEISGSLIRQIHSAFDFLNLANNLPAKISGLQRVEQYDYPEEAVREAMLNALIHRDYAFSSSNIVNIYDDRMEFVSLGGLVPGLMKEDLYVGISHPRNEKLAGVFHRLNYIEAYGTGIRKIMHYYEDYSFKPDITVTNAAFVLTLPNINYMSDMVLNQEKEVKPQFKQITEYLKSHDSITNKDVQEILGVGQTRAYTIIREMLEASLIKKNDYGSYVSV